MTTRKSKDTRTTMYSVDEQGGVVTHQLPWPKDSEKIAPLKARGFTFERPSEMPLVSKEVAEGAVLMPTTKDKGIASLKKAREAKATKKKV